MKRNSLLPFLGALILLVLSSPVRAAEEFLNWYMLGSPEIRQEIQLAPETTVQIKALLSESIRLNQGGLMTMETAKALEEQRKKTPPETLIKKALALLTPQQKERLQQIQLQQSRSYVLNSSTLIKRLEVTPTQVSKVQTGQQQVYEKYRRQYQLLEEKLSRSMKDGKASEETHQIEKRMQVLQTTRQLQDRQVMEQTLTPEQKIRLKTILGRPFTAKITSDLPAQIMN